MMTTDKCITGDKSTEIVGRKEIEKKLVYEEIIALDERDQAIDEKLYCASGIINFCRKL